MPRRNEVSVTKEDRENGHWESSLLPQRGGTSSVRNFPPMGRVLRRHR